MTTLPRLLISAAHKSSGKTTVSIGLAAALRARGLAVQPFKKGPDYIDPMWLARASGRPCFNLDPYLSSDEAMATTLARESGGADLALVEGNKGLHDGMALDGSNANAALAKRLGLPVVLVIDARGMTRGIAPLILGFQAFDRGVRIAGVILNQVGGPRHEGKLRAVIEHYTDVPVLGAVARDLHLTLPERHLGLTPDAEFDSPAERVADIARIVGAGVDLDRVIQVAASAAALEMEAAAPAVRAGRPDLRIGVARGAAFGFYYPDDLAALQAAGAELVPVDMLHDQRLPALDGLFIGGGFPEVYMTELEANRPLRAALKSAIEAGLPVHAECGGLMLLARSIRWGTRHAEMVGAIPGDVVMHSRPVGRGYLHLQATEDHPWDEPGCTLRGHEFHHSSLENLPPGTPMAYRVTRGHGVDGRADGVRVHNVIASYAHLRSGAGADWATRFVGFARRIAAERAARLAA
jgi:cobyrinic acid a,c-diamide synthase